MNYSKLKKDGCVALFGDIRTGKTRTLTNIAAEALINNQRVCVVEVKEKSCIEKYLGDLVNYYPASHFVPTEMEFPKDMDNKQLMFMQVPLAAVEKNLKIFDLTFIFKLFTRFDVILFDEGHLTLHELIQTKRLNGVLKLAQDLGKLVIVAAQSIQQLEVDGGEEVKFNSLYVLEHSNEIPAPKILSEVTGADALGAFLKTTVGNLNYITIHADDIANVLKKVTSIIDDPTGAVKGQTIGSPKSPVGLTGGSISGSKIGSRNESESKKEQDSSGTKKDNNEFNFRKLFGSLGFLLQLYVLVESVNEILSKQEYFFANTQKQILKQTMDKLEKMVTEDINVVVNMNVFYEMLRTEIESTGKSYLYKGLLASVESALEDMGFFIEKVME